MEIFRRRQLKMGGMRHFGRVFLKGSRKSVELLVKLTHS